MCYSHHKITTHTGTSVTRYMLSYYQIYIYPKQYITRNSTDPPEMKEKNKAVICLYYVKHAFFFSRAVLFWRPRSLLALARGPSVHYDACRDPGGAPWRCSEHSRSPSWLFFFKALHSASLSPVGVNGKTHIFFSNSSLYFQLFYPLRYRFFSRASKRAFGTLRRVSGSRPSSVAVL